MKTVGNVSVRLQTLCGCTRIMVYPAPAPEVIHLPIQDVTEPGGPVAFRTRRFELRRLSPSEYSVEADYVEVADPS